MGRGEIPDNRRVAEHTGDAAVDKPEVGRGGERSLTRSQVEVAAGVEEDKK